MIDLIEAIWSKCKEPITRSGTYVTASQPKVPNPRSHHTYKFTANFKWTSTQLANPQTIGFRKSTTPVLRADKANSTN